MTMATQNPKHDRAQAQKATVRMQGDREMHVERIFNAPRDRVWKAMTDPKLVAQWWGRGNKLVIEKMEVKKGGHWRYVEHSDGAEHGFEGRYREVRAPEFIESTFEWDGAPGHASIDSMRLEDMGDGRTKLIVKTLFMTAEDRDGMVSAGMESGMNESYEALDRVLAGMG
jgi:uncharacterized protein YndB with AHSA1/START domain